MSWSEIGGTVEYVKYSECKPDQLLAEGWYQGTQKSKFNDVHIFRTKDGRKVGLNSSGHLNYIMGQVKTNEYVKVIYAGKKKLESGKFAGKEAHTFAAFRADNGPCPDPIDPTSPAEEDDPLS